MPFAGIVPAEGRNASWTWKVAIAVALNQREKREKARTVPAPAFLADRNGFNAAGQVPVPDPGRRRSTFRAASVFPTEQVETSNEQQTSTASPSRTTRTTVSARITQWESRHVARPLWTCEVPATVCGVNEASQGGLQSESCKGPRSHGPTLFVSTVGGSQVASHAWLYG